MKFSLKHKSAVVTGGGSGIGQAICMALAANGAHVHILDLQKEKAMNTQEAIIASGGTATIYVCSVAHADEVNTVVAAITEKADIDILINNAGIAHIGNLEGTEETDLDRLYAVNIKGVYNCMRACIGSMKKKGGVIINMASIASTVGLTDRFAYSMTKGAVLTMTYSVAKDYLADGIRCNSISPARIHTTFVDDFIRNNYPDNQEEMFEKLSRSQPVGRMGRPEEVAHLALYLCSDEAAFITGTDFPIDGGFIKLNSQ